MLELQTVDTFYGPSQVLDDVSLQVNQGEIVCLLGANAAGKTTTMKTIFGIVRPKRGTVAFEGQQISGTPTDNIIGKGLALVPEGRRVFSRMTVRENLEMGAYMRNNRAEFTQDIELVYTLFPRLKERDKQITGTMSGGEQQMLAIGRALMARPKLLMLDEPSMGIAPILVQRIYETIAEINRQGTTILLVEQNANFALEVAKRGYVLETGTVALTDSASSLRENPEVQKAYLGA